MPLQAKYNVKAPPSIANKGVLVVASKWWVHAWACLFVFILFSFLLWVVQLKQAVDLFALFNSVQQTTVPVSHAVFAFMASALLCVAVLVTQKFHGRFSLDDDLDAVQKLHSQPVPRIGGLPIFLAFFATLASVLLPTETQFFVALLVASAPVFVAGFWEDLTKRVSARLRLFWAMVSGLLACFFLGAVVNDLGLAWLNNALAWAPFAFVFSAFAMAGMANAINIIDGLNGLASGVVCLIAVALAFLSAQLGDGLLVSVSVVLAFSVLGFWLFNFPFGRIFLGDGGAYLMGLLLGALAILLKARNPEMDAWLILSVLAYPVVEVVFSIFRRVKTKASPDQPDFKHFHQLIQRFLVDCINNATPANVTVSKLRVDMNSNTTPFLWCFCMFTIVLAFAGNFLNWAPLGFVLTLFFYTVSYYWLARRVLKLEAK